MSLSPNADSERRSPKHDYKKTLSRERLGDLALTMIMKDLVIYIGLFKNFS